MTLDFRFTVPGWGFSGAQEATACWKARSPGLDRIYTPYPEKLAYWMAYDPSNGLHSIGDIILSDKGLLGETFEGNDGTSDYL